MILDLNDALEAALKAQTSLPDDLSRLTSRYHTPLPLRHLAPESTARLLTLAREHDASTARRIDSYLAVQADPGRKLKQLRPLEEALHQLIRKTEHGWLFKEHGGQMLPYLVTNVSYTAPDAKNGQQAEVSVTTQAWNTFTSLRLSFVTNDLAGSGGRSAAQLLNDRGVFLETPDLTRAFFADQAYHQQVSAHDHALLDVDGAAWKHDGHRSQSHRIINQAILDTSQHKDERPAPSLAYWQNQNEDLPRFHEVPVHPYLHVFDLKRHVHVFVHARSTRLHVFRRSSHQIVLPPLHRRLIEVLTHHGEVLHSGEQGTGGRPVTHDVIEGKNASTTVICTGPPGTGKTLTAEIYAEDTGRALYRVHSGQLGLNGEQVEKRLEAVFRNAERWKAVLLIDEADIYVRERGNDLTQNAIVAAFLRTIEYFQGLMFLTSNRDDIDDAIRSRAVAVIRYDTPGHAEAVAIWTLLSTHADIALSGDLTGWLASTYPEASGRDILQLLGLATRYADALGRPLDRQAFKDCAPFRGLGLKPRETR